jgi:hypothetical protein
MLAPSDRKVILESLRPPDGYRIDRAIATTYTLDLVALLLAPLSFSLYDAVADRDKSLDSLALIRAVREHASRISVFCQAEGIACPARYPLLAQYLEDTVVAVQAPNPKGVFHVKLWVLRFVANGDDEPVRYRVLVPSRNLTFDRSWDALLTLDGVLTDRSRAYARNHPLADLVAALPKLAVRPPSERIVADCSLAADELRRVDFEIPAPFEDMSFYPLGMSGRRQPDPFEERMDRVLVISPFVSSKCLGGFIENAKQCTLVSRVEELARLYQAALEPWAGRVYVLDEETTPDEDEGAEEELQLAIPEAPPPHGLHAKIYVADAGWDAHVWTGSANATDAAFERNVEILVKLSGKKTKVGIDAILGEGKDGSFQSLLRAYTTTDAETAEPDGYDIELDEAARTLATAHWQASVQANDADGERYSVALSTATSIALPNVRVSIWPITLTEGRALTWVREPLKFDDCSFESLTPFFAFRISIQGDVSRTTTFVVRAVLDGLPENRSHRLLQTLFQDPQRLMRFLEILLSSDPLSTVGEELTILESVSRNAARVQTNTEPPLFEMFVRALSRDPTRLDQVKSVIDELATGTSTHPFVTDDFRRIWEPIWRARQTAVRRGSAQ